MELSTFYLLELIRFIFANLTPLILFILQDLLIFNLIDVILLKCLHSKYQLNHSTQVKMAEDLIGSGIYIASKMSHQHLLKLLL
jgi:hypothetical protein